MLLCCLLEFSMVSYKTDINWLSLFQVKYLYRNRHDFFFSSLEFVKVTKSTSGYISSFNIFHWNHIFVILSSLRSISFSENPVTCFCISLVFFLSFYIFLSSFPLLTAMRCYDIPTRKNISWKTNNNKWRQRYGGKWKFYILLVEMWNV